ncbi:MAG: trypsin-like peptidase domain-containing protein [Lachnospiraceae bacterium]|nr:trypsin-like peptidase domain-containing protein [Lachnospiraceae bacterium]
MNTFKKIMTSICLGLLFGVFGGLGFFAVQKTTGLTTKDGGVINEQSAEVNESTSTNEKTDKDETPVTTQTTVVNTVDTNESTSEEVGVMDVAEALMPAMVSINKEYEYSYGTDFYSYYFGGSEQKTLATASGSGFIVAQTDTEYLIVSNNHVVEDPVSLEVTFVDGSTASAYIKGLDPDMDVAVIAVQKSDVSDETASAIRIAIIGDSSDLRLGQQVVAIGNALGYGQSVTTGIISAIDREITTDDGNTATYIQTDAAINPGNSGGALINMSGEVIGINSSKIGGTAVEGMGYAIPISSVTDIINELMDHQTKIPIDEEDVGYIGITLQEVTDSLSQRFNIPVGIYIVDVVDGGAAQKAGLQTGDVITKFAGEKIKSYDDLQNVIKYYAVGTTVDVTYQRAENGVYKEYTVSLTLGSKPDEAK